MAHSEKTNVRLMAEELIDRIFELPPESQLGIVRTVAPRVIAGLESGERAGFLRDLASEVEEAARGERTYDLRPGLSHDHRH